jgi:hypothetical protein
MMTVSMLRDRVQTRLISLLVTGNPAIKPKPRALRPRVRSEAKLNDAWNDRLAAVAAKGN